MTVDVKIEAPALAELIGGLDKFAADQLPFALSMGMNRAAKDAVQVMRRELSSVFDLRRGSLRATFGPSGKMGDVARGWSSKKQWPNLFVDLHSVAPSTRLQEDGGTKPFRAPQVWIASREIPRSATTGKKPQRLQPSRIRKRLEGKQRGPRRVFDRGGVIYERDRRSGQVTPLYLRRDRATIRPVLGFEDIVRRTYAAKLGPRFTQAMRKAVRSRR